MKEIHGFPASAEGLARVVKRLRQPDGCPWDQAQTIESLAPGIAGECAEVVEAIDLHDRANLCEELGDLLMNTVFMAVLADEEGAFDWEQLCAEVIEKMVRRHPHVFGNAHAADVGDVLSIWQQAKAAEKPAGGTPDSIYAKPILSLSALDRATAVQKQASKVGFDWPDAAGVVAKIQEETAELAEAFATGDDAAIDEELGDLLFAAVNLARYRKRASADALLRAACRKFIGRFQCMEAQLASSGRRAAECSQAELEAAYQEAKRREKAKGGFKG